MAEADALEALRQHGTEVEVGLDGLILTLPGPRLSRLEDVLALLPVVSICALPILSMNIARMDYTDVNVSMMMTILGVFWVGVMLLLMTLPAAARSRRRTRLLLTDRALRCRDQLLPLESLEAIFIDRQRALLMMEGVKGPALVVSSDTDTLQALQSLLYDLSIEHRKMLRAAGHDLSQRSAPPEAIQALRGVVS